MRRSGLGTAAEPEALWELRASLRRRLVAPGAAARAGLWGCPGPAGKKAAAGGVRHRAELCVCISLSVLSSSP